MFNSIQLKKIHTEQTETMLSTIYQQFKRMKTIFM